MHKIILLLLVPLFISLSDPLAAQTTNPYKASVDSAAMLKQVRRRLDSLIIVIKKTSDTKTLAKLYTGRGLSEFKLNNLDSAIRDYTTAIALNRQMKEAWLFRGAAYENQGKYENAIKDDETALSFYRNDRTGLLSLYGAIGFMQMKLKNYPKALEADSIAITLNPNDFFAYGNCGWVFLYTGKYDKAIEYFTISINNNNKNNKIGLSQQLFGRGTAKRSLKKYREAINDYTLAIEINPDNEAAHWNKAACYLQNGDYELADQEYTKTITYHNGDSTNLALLYDDRAQVKIGEKKYKEALRDDSIAILYNNKLANAYWYSATACAQNGDFRLSIDWYNRSIKYYQGNNSAIAVVYNAISNEAFFLAQYDIAIEKSSAAIALNANAWSPYLNRGRAYLKQGKPGQALADFKKVLALDTTKKSYEYAFALFYTGNGDQAIQLMQSNIVSANDPAVLISHYYNVACLYSLMNKPDEANSYLKKCIDLGYSKRYAQLDPDLENIRGTQDFIDMMKTN